MDNLKIVLTAYNQPRLLTAWHKYFDDLDFVEVYNGSILDLSVDAIVSPANSFGFMDGGIDMAYSQHFGWHVQDNLQECIKNLPRKELLVGESITVPTNNNKIRFVICSPTMRAPMILEKNTVNPYLAAKSVLLSIKNDKIEGDPAYQWINSIAFPGLGTGIGRVSAEICAKQIRKSVDEVVLNMAEYPKSWQEVSTKHQKLYTDILVDMQLESFN